MADFPSTVYPSYKSSGEQWRDPILTDFSKSGAFRGRRLQPAKKRSITLVFRLLDSTDRGALQTHYDAHRDTTFNFTWSDGSGGPYSVAYGAELNWVKVGHNLYDCTVLLVEV